MEYKTNNSFTKFKYNKFNPSVNEWINSIYTYEPGWDKKNSNLINNKISHNLINSYFNMKFHIKKKVIYRLGGKKKFVNWLRPLAHLSLNKIFIGIPEFKHNLQSLNILIYIFNKEETLLLKKINKLKKINFLSSSNIESNNQSKFVLEKFKVRPHLFFKERKVISNNLSVSVNAKIIKFYAIKSIYFNIINMRRPLGTVKFRYYKIFLYKLYLAKLYFNKYKFNYNNLFYLKKLLFNIYKASGSPGSKINLNIVNLKYLHLDNSIYIQAITRKLKDRNKKVLRVLRNALILPKIPIINNLLMTNKKILNKLGLGFDRFESIKNIITLFSNGKVYKTYNDLNYTNKEGGLNVGPKKSIFYGIKNTHIVGVRLEGSGRLTRRLTASRAVHKIAYLGSLKNIFSSYQGLSSVINKGFEKSNINYINQNSNNRNGSFGIKSWQNTM